MKTGYCGIIVISWNEEAEEKMFMWDFHIREWGSGFGPKLKAMWTRHMKANSFLFPPTLSSHLRLDKMPQVRNVVIPAIRAAALGIYQQAALTRVFPAINVHFALPWLQHPVPPVEWDSTSHSCWCRWPCGKKKHSATRVAPAKYSGAVISRYDAKVKQCIHEGCSK